jgi:excisionase family DNA binding protein
MPHVVSPIPPPEKRAYRINEAVAAYRLSRSTLYKLMSAGTLRTVKVAGRRLIPRDALEALIAEGAK